MQFVWDEQKIKWFVDASKYTSFHNVLAKKLKYSLELDSIEFGQPLRSQRDAELFVLQNAPKADAEEISNFLDKNLVSTRRDDFPLYLPNKKELGIFIINAEE